jgi:hypothetical protein
VAERSRARRALALACVVALAAVACTGGDGGGRAGRNTSSTTPTTLVDYSTVVLSGVNGQTTSTIRDKGTSQIKGTVTGPDGPVPNATVKIEHLVLDQSRLTDVKTAADGTFALPDVPGGRYRVRAFLFPSLALVEPELFFLTEGDTRELRLELSPYEGLTATAAVAPDPPLLGYAVNLVVQLETRSVDSHGVVHASAQSGMQVELLSPGRWVMSSDAFAITDDHGQARFSLECQAVGNPDLSLRLYAAPIDTTTSSSTSSTILGEGQGEGTQQAPPQQPPDTVAPADRVIRLSVPACIDPASTTTTTIATTSTSSKPTSTTKKP